MAVQALVIGAGPAGLMAAEMLAAAGLRAMVVDRMPTVGRKLLMAGKSGLNLTKDEPPDEYLAAFGEVPGWFRAILAEFGPREVMDWAEGLGQPVFTGTTGRVFPRAMKASPLLRAWMARLEQGRVEFRLRWRWTGRHEGRDSFETPVGAVAVEAGAVVLALGGASWSRLGPDGAWAAQMAGQTAPFAPANVGLRVAWSAHMQPHFGAPVKGCALTAGAQTGRGEFVISARGLEGGGIYALSRSLRAGAGLCIDLLPDLPVAVIRQKLAAPQGKASQATHLRKRLRLDPVRIALLNEFGRPFPADLAPLLKSLPVGHQGPRPLDEAISTAGGLRLDALDAGLMLRDRPGVFAAGEMLDWEAPTGGYLISGCLATGRRAGQAAAEFLSRP